MSTRTEEMGHAYVFSTDWFCVISSHAYSHSNDSSVKGSSHIAESKVACWVSSDR